MVSLGKLEALDPLEMRVQRGHRALRVTQVFLGHQALLERLDHQALKGPLVHPDLEEIRVSEDPRDQMEQLDLLDQLDLPALEELLVIQVQQVAVVLQVFRVIPVPLGRLAAREREVYLDCRESLDNQGPLDHRVILDFLARQDSPEPRGFLESLEILVLLEILAKLEMWACQERLGQMVHRVPLVPLAPVVFLEQEGRLE